jgi:hypothetical protein
LTVTFCKLAKLNEFASVPVPDVRSTVVFGKASVATVLANAVFLGTALLDPPNAVAKKNDWRLSFADNE